jgi:hypothetical protein
LCHLEHLGVILVHRHLPEAERLYQVALGMFHELTWEAMTPPSQNTAGAWATDPSLKRVHLADRFVAGFLMPRETLTALIPEGQWEDVAHLRTVADQLHVTPTALAFHLFHLGWISEDVRHALASSAPLMTEPDVWFPPRFSRALVQALHQALARGQLSARKAAKTMGLSLQGLRDLFEDHQLPAPFDL